MPPLYVVKQGAKLRIRNRRVNVEFDNETLTSIPINQVSEVLLFGRIGLTTPAISAFFQCDIDVVFLSRSGNYKGHLTTGVTPHVPLRQAQYDRLKKSEFVLEMAKGFVLAKLRHQRALLQRHTREKRSEAMKQYIKRLNRALEKVPYKTKINSLRGLEGAAAAAYFDGFRELIGPAWNFTKRTYRPSPDPINVLLSFGYTLATSLSQGAIQACGLDVYAGFLHFYTYNKPALALDLVEEFRPVVDGVILWVCRSGQITLDDFSKGTQERPIILSERGQKRFLKAYEERFRNRYTHPIREQRLTIKRCLFEQARQIAKRIKENRPGYTGMGFR